MEPITHTLMGAVLARTGLNRRAAYTTAAMAVAAEFPDIDTVWSFAGPVTGFKHHRGITHTLLGLPVEAAILVAVFWGVHAWRKRRSAALQSAPPHLADDNRNFAPINWPALYGFVLLALLSHIFLDWMNNYGVRPFFPFDPHWHAASLLFIFDPVVFLLLLGALTLPALFRLVGREIGAQTSRFAPRRWAVGALVCLAATLGFQAAEHARAVPLAMAESVETGEGEKSRLLTPVNVLASPDPFSPFRWHAVADLGPFLQLEEIDSHRGVVSLGDERLDKVARTPEIEAALHSPLGQVYLDWSPMPAISVSAGENGSATIVFFRDPRFMGDVPSLNRSGPPPLTGVVEVDARGRVAGQSLDGREQRTSVR